MPAEQPESFLDGFLPEEEPVVEKPRKPAKPGSASPESSDQVPNQKPMPEGSGGGRSVEAAPAEPAAEATAERVAEQSEIAVLLRQLPDHDRARIQEELARYGGSWKLERKRYLVSSMLREEVRQIHQREVRIQQRFGRRATPSTEPTELDERISNLLDPAESAERNAERLEPLRAELGTAESITVQWEGDTGHEAVVLRPDTSEAPAEDSAGDSVAESPDLGASELEFEQQMPGESAVPEAETPPETDAPDAEPGKVPTPAAGEMQFDELSAAPETTVQSTSRELRTTSPLVEEQAPTPETTESAWVAERITTIWEEPEYDNLEVIDDPRPARTEFSQFMSELFEEADRYTELPPVRGASPDAPGADGRQGTPDLPFDRGKPDVVAEVVAKLSRLRKRPIRPDPEEDLSPIDLETEPESLDPPQDKPEPRSPEGRERKHRSVAASAESLTRPRRSRRSEVIVWEKEWSDPRVLPDRRMRQKARKLIKSLASEYGIRLTPELEAYLLAIMLRPAIFRGQEIYGLGLNRGVLTSILTLLGGSYGRGRP